MSATIVSTLATATLGLTATPTPISTVLPDHITPFEVRIVGSEAFEIRGPGDTVGFPIAANVAYPIPVSGADQILLNGSGTVTILVLGDAR